MTSGNGNQRFALFGGCDVPRKSTPELFMSAMAVCQKLGIEVEELKFAPCTGSGIVQSKDQRFADTLNASTLAMAEDLGMPLMVICSTCQGVLSQTNQRFRENPDYLAEINKELEGLGLQYKGTAEVKHLMWVFVEHLGLDQLQKMVTRPLTGLKVAPFYGCYIVRPSSALGFEEHPERQDSLERVIRAVGAEVVDFRGKNQCCGYPIVGDNEPNAWAMVGNHTMAAKELGADVMVTPCPLCHMNLDGVQPQVAQTRETRIGLPVIHLPQMVGLALGMQAWELGFDRHAVPIQSVLEKIGAA